MIHLIAALFLIPVIMGIIIVSPFDAEEKTVEIEPQIDEEFSKDEQTGLVTLILAVFWFLLLVQILKKHFLIKNSKMDLKCDS